MRYGQGSPEGSLPARVGSLYTRLNGGIGTTLYVKEANATSSGWSAVATIPAGTPLVAGRVVYTDSSGQLATDAGLAYNAATDALTVAGVATVAQLTISTAVGKIVPGATSLSLRNNADSADNLLITNAGVVTVRSDATVAGGLNVGTATAGSGNAGTVAMRGASALLRIAGSATNQQIGIFLYDNDATLESRMTYAGSNGAGNRYAGFLSDAADYAAYGSINNVRAEIWTNTTARVRVETTGNVKIAGSATRGTTEGTNHLDIFDGTAPVGTLANGISLYSTSGELRVMDAGGTATLLSPHDDDNYWIFDSVDTRTGRKLKIEVEKLLRFLNDHFNLDYIHGDMTREAA